MTQTRFALIDGEIPLEFLPTPHHYEPRRPPTSADYGFPYGFVHNRKAEVILERHWLLSPWDAQFLKDTLHLDLIDRKFYESVTNLRNGYY
jgi:hypothetical protein